MLLCSTEFEDSCAGNGPFRLGDCGTSTAVPAPELRVISPKNRARVISKTISIVMNEIWEIKVPLWDDLPQVCVDFAQSSSEFMPVSDGTEDATGAREYQS